MTVIELADDSKFVDHLTEAGQKLAVVDFFATWYFHYFCWIFNWMIVWINLKKKRCGPCNMIAPFYKVIIAKRNHQFEKN